MSWLHVFVSLQMVMNETLVQLKDITQLINIFCAKSVM